MRLVVCEYPPARFAGRVRPALVATGAALLLAGCTHDQPGIQVKTVTVDRIVERPCPATTPIRPPPLAKPLPDNLEALAAALAEKLAEYSAPGQYADQADAIIKRCTTP